MTNPIAHLQLVRKIARQSALRFQWEEFDDLYQEGCIGLLKACQRHDGRQGWTEYACRYIRGEIGHYVRRTIGRKKGKYASLDHQAIRIDSLPGFHLPDVQWMVRQERREDWQSLMAVWDSQWEHNPLERSVLELRFFEGLTRKEVGDRLGLTLRQVDHYARYGLIHLRWAYLFSLEVAA